MSGCLVLSDSRFTFRTGGVCLFNKLNNDELNKKVLYSFRKFAHT